MSAYRIQDADGATAQDFAELHQEVFGRSAWSATSFASSLAAPGVAAIAARNEGALAGFAVARICAGEAEVLTIGVRPDFRRKGVGLALIDAVEARAAARGAAAVYLEVSADNAAALGLYARAGYATVGRRAAYYADGSDALILKKKIS